MDDLCATVSVGSAAARGAESAGRALFVYMKRLQQSPRDVSALANMEGYARLCINACIRQRPLSTEV